MATHSFALPPTSRRGSPASLAFAGLLVASATLSLAPVPASAEVVTEALRDQRYCELLLAYPDGRTLSQEVYNTQGLNDCPEEQWQALDMDQLAEENNAAAVLPNGPRHWTMDRIIASGSSNTGQVKNFDGLEMSLRGVLTGKLRSLFTSGAKPYRTKTVARETTYVFEAGKAVYELTDRDGNVYVMQSYSQQVDSTLTMAQLPSLGSRLKLPKGWSYAERVLSQELQLTATGQATVVTDDFANTYQKR